MYASTQISISHQQIFVIYFVIILFSQPSGLPITVLLATTDEEAKKWINDAILEHNTLTVPRKGVRKTGRRVSKESPAPDIAGQQSASAPIIDHLTTIVNAAEVEEIVDAETGLYRIRRDTQMSLGFDAEWKPTRSRFDKSKVSVVQLSTASSVMIIQTSKTDVRKATWKMLNFITNSRKVIKVGIGIQADLKKITSDYGKTEYES